YSPLIRSESHGAAHLQHRLAVGRYLDFYHAFVQLTSPQFLAKFLSRTLEKFVLAGLLHVVVAITSRLHRESRAADERIRSRFLRGRHEDIENAILGEFDGAGTHGVRLLVPQEIDGDVDEVADHAVHDATHIPDLREFCGFDLDERCTGQFRQSPSDLGLADTGGADHDDVVRHDLI